MCSATRPCMIRQGWCGHARIAARGITVTQQRAPRCRYEAWRRSEMRSVKPVRKLVRALATTALTLGVFAGLGYSAQKVDIRRAAKAAQDHVRPCLWHSPCSCLPLPEMCRRVNLVFGLHCPPPVLQGEQMRLAIVPVHNSLSRILQRTLATPENQEHMWFVSCACCEGPSFIGRAMRREGHRGRIQTRHEFLHACRQRCRTWWRRPSRRSQMLRTR